jgi:hypothetical protein
VGARKRAGGFTAQPPGMSLIAFANKLGLPRARPLNSSPDVHPKLGTSSSRHCRRPRCQRQPHGQRSPSLQCCVKPRTAPASLPRTTSLLRAEGEQDGVAVTWVTAQDDQSPEAVWTQRGVSRHGVLDGETRRCWPNFTSTASHFRLMSAFRGDLDETEPRSDVRFVPQANAPAARTASLSSCSVTPKRSFQ